MIPNGYLSPSRINTFARCAMQFYWRYVEGKIMPPGIAVLKGSAIDKVCQKDLTKKMDTGKNLSKSDMIEVFTEFIETSIQGVDPEDADVQAAGGPEKAAEATLSQADGIVGAYQHWGEALLPISNPRGIQMETRAEVGGYPMLGVVDVREAGRIWDLKLSGRRKTDADAENNNQLRLYQIMEKKNNRPVNFAALYSIYPLTRSWKAQELGQMPSVEADNRMESFVNLSGRQMEAGIFPPVNLDSKNSWACSKKYCGYWRMCPYGEKGRTRVKDEG